MIDNEQTLPYAADLQTLAQQPHAQGKLVTQTISPRNYAHIQDDYAPTKERRLLGKGGMGIVFEELEALPQRSVAVKELLHYSPDRAQALIFEADLMGRLEHPNIPPIHRVSTSPPSVTMKLVEGKTFWDILDGTPQQGESLYKALDILIQVSHALEYAHEKGIVHRDIKPENVMVGRFNAVYLMDWGLSFELEKKRGQEMPLAGTPAYMAPEMLLDNYSYLGTCTDVYLMGALLHEILTGMPRHVATTLDEVLIQVNQSAPYEYDTDTPQELASLCNQSCSREPAMRPKSIVEFREAILLFLSHANALSFAKAAEEKRLTLERRLVLGEDEEGLLYSLAAQARFGFEQALEQWPECSLAKNGLQAVLVRFIERAIRVGDVDRARLLYQELPVPVERLLLDCAEKERELQEEERQLKAFSRMAEELDPRQSFQSRFLLQAVLTTMVFVVIFISRVLKFDFWSEYVHQRVFFSILCVFVPVWCVLVARYRTITQNAFGRQAMRTIGLGSLAITFNRFMVFGEHVSIGACFSIDLIIISLSLSNAAPAVRLGPRLALLGLATAFVSLFVPSHSDDLMYVFSMCVAIIISWDWHSESKEREKKLRYEV